MKVLFAISNDKMSELIVRQYQKEYKQIISYKNVYYFNAILKELQRDKGYERIVISEDLEQFTNNDYEQMDKFMFDRLDSISDEASNMNGEDIPILLICSERRAKSEPILTKLFGIGIYNAIIGNDRSVNEVCRLLNRPRSKKEAKVYYKIDSKEVTYSDDEKEDDVSELEIQNILAHYKRIANDETKYVESFDSIASQYNNKQLKVISKCLPLNVRAVLEEKSAKYQEVNSYNNKITDVARVTKKEKKGPSEMFLTKTKTLNEPVVVPSAIDASKKKKITSAQTSQVNLNRPESNTGVFDKAEEKINKLPEIQLEETPIIPETKLEDIPAIPETELEEIPAIPEIKLEETNIIEDTPILEQENIQPEEPVKRKRGRPRKVVEEPLVQAPKRKRGRPRKVVEQPEEILPGLEDTLENEEESILPGLTNNEEENILPGLTDNEEENILPGLVEEEVQEVKPENLLMDEQEENVLPGLMDDDSDTVLPGLMGEEQEEVLPGLLENNSEPEPVIPRTNSMQTQNEEEAILPVFESNNIDDEYTNVLQSLKNENEKEEYRNIPQRKEEIQYPELDINSIILPSQKLVAFLGTSKNGTSFLINNVAELLAANGINTAILDLTHNRNAYYIYTKNEDNLREQSNYIMKNLIEGKANGIQDHKNLTVYTTAFEDDEDLKSVEPIIETLMKAHTVVLMDCDFSTPMRYFKYAQEIYLVQSMDILTIQPLTAFVRQLSDKGMFEESKARVILNKFMRTKEINEELLIGGISIYNDAGMTVRKELFNRRTVPYMTVPFELKTYLRYLDGLVVCDVSLKGYSKEFMQSLKKLASMIYKNGNDKGNYAPPSIRNNNGFSSNMNGTLDQMKQNY